MRRQSAKPAPTPAAVAACPRCKQPVRVGRHKATGSLIIHCASCNTHFPDAANTQRLIDTNVVNGWNVYAKLQSKLESGTELNQADFVAAFEQVRASLPK